jgi:hypothetical protein
MIEILHTDKGEIKAVCEYYIVDEKGNFDSKGEFVWINEVEISPSFRGNGILKTFAKNIMEREPQAKFGYFWRQYKYPNRRPRIYHRVQWLKLIGGI